MKRVAVLPTGRAEWHGLPVALSRLFPAQKFYALPAPEEVASHPDRFPLRGFTSNPLAASHETEPPEESVELVQRAAGAALGDRRVEPAAAVIIIDDLELSNAHQPRRAIHVLRRAVEVYLSRLQGQRAATEKALCDRVSFHLTVPMIEAWMFADPGALAAAGVPADRPPFITSGDVEDFRTDDAAYLAATDADCPCWTSRGRKKKRRPKWLGDQPRDRHPKGYLQWLCRDGDHPDCTTYAETTSGANALAGLRWESLFTRDGSRYARALVADLAEVLQETPAIGIIDEPDPAPTSLHRRPRNPVLRNL